MPRVALAPEVADDIDRVFQYVTRHDPEGAPARVGEIIDAISVLETNPLIGRPARGNTRELVIGRRSRGFIALYRYEQAIDTVFVLALRNQREAGYRGA